MQCGLGFLPGSELPHESQVGEVGFVGGGPCCEVQVDPSVSLHPADVSGIDWMVRHGRSLALSVAVNVAPSRLCAGRYSSEVQDMILSNAMADRVRLWGSQTWCSETWVQILPLPVTYCALGLVLDLSGPQFHHLNSEEFGLEHLEVPSRSEGL